MTNFARAPVGQNALIFVPLATAHRMNDGGALIHSLMAFLAFSLCASSVYLLNDMLDLESDRQHHSKCRRPLRPANSSLLFERLW